MFELVGVTASKEKVKRMTHLVNKYGKIVIPITAFSPLPYLPALIGVMNFSFRNFLIYGVIPRFASILFFGWLFSLM
jgi:membrane protein YqaA with SNARE-associated domain